MLKYISGCVVSISCITASSFLSAHAGAEYVCFDKQAVTELARAASSGLYTPRLDALAKQHCRIANTTGMRKWKKVGGCQIYRGKASGRTAYTYSETCGSE